MSPKAVITVGLCLFACLYPATLLFRTEAFENDLTQRATRALPARGLDSTLQAESQRPELFANPAGPYVSLAIAQEAGAVTINYGLFINTVISFVIVAFAVYLLIRQLNKLRKQEEAPPAEATKKDCGFCFSAIPIKATRCPNCTSQIET